MKEIPGLLEYFLQDCLDGDKSFTVRRMFGGYGIYRYQKIFAIYAFDQIYFKTGFENKEDFLHYQAKQFSYEKKGETQTICYYVLPEEIMENKVDLYAWIEKSLRV